MLDVIVIGGGPAGVTAGLRARELGASVALVERDRMGGTCTNNGCVPTRVFARAARLARDAAQFDRYGLIAEEPELDFLKLMKCTEQVVYTIHEKKQLISTLQDSGAHVHTGKGEAKFVDHHVIELANGDHLEGQNIILCVGGSARRLGFPGAEHAHTLGDLWSLQSIPPRMAIVGAGPTGCQVASIFAAFGTQVTLLEMADRILMTEDSSVSVAIHDSFINHQINILTELDGVERIEKDGSELVLRYLQNEKPVDITVDAVVLSVGWPGNIEGLNLEAADVDSERGFILVDDYLRTSTPHIFAAGDITGRMGLVQSANYDARIAAENAVLGAGEAYKHRIVPHGGFTDPEYGSVGWTEEKAVSENHDIVTAQVPYADLDRAVIDGRTEGMCKLVVSKENHRILGAHVVGEQALEVVHLVAAGMSADMWVEQLAELEIAYPTYTAVIGLAARQVIRKLGVVPLAPEWRALGKQLSTEWERRDSDLEH